MNFVSLTLDQLMEKFCKF